MICPKCADIMRTYERHGVHIEQCENCRGVFLDRGELEELVELEYRRGPEPVAVPPPVAAYEPPAAAVPAPSPRQEYRPPDYDRYRDDRYRDPYHDDPYYRKKKRKKHILEELFDL